MEGQMSRADSEIDDLQQRLDDKCDEYRIAQETIGELRLLLAKHNIDHDL